MSQIEPRGRQADDTVKAPSWLLLMLEGRAPWEFGASVMAAPVLKRAPRGDGHPVLVFPGFITGNFSTVVLRSFLGAQGYTCYAWEQGLNLGLRTMVMDACLEQVKRLRIEHNRTVSLVGWSLGGIYAREIAKITPGDVRQVITLGTPFAGHPKATNAWRLYEFVSGRPLADGTGLDALKYTPPVPTTSIYSRTDGVVAWQCSVERESDRSENIEIHASHFGMAVNPTALYAIADRLAQPEERWRRFDRNSYGLLGRVLYREYQPQSPQS